MNAAVYKRILTSSVIILVLGVVVNLSGLVKELFVAQRFGTGNQLDIFTMGFAIPLFLVGLSSSAMSSVVVPAYIASREHVRLAQFIPDAIRLVLLASGCQIVLSIVATMVLMPYMATGFDAEKLHQSMVVGLLLVPVILIQNLSSFLDSILNSEDKSIYNNTIALFLPLGTVILIVLTTSISPWVLCAGLVLGYSLKLAFQMYPFLQISRSYGAGYTHAGVSPSQPLVRRNQALIKEFGWLIFSSVILGLLPIIAQSYAASLYTGAVSSLNYANKLIGIGLVILSNVITVVFLPFISKEITRDTQAGVQVGVRLAVVVLVLLFVILIPVYFGLQPIVRLVLERGRFDRQSTAHVVEVLQMMIWYVPFYVSSTLLARLVVALNRSSVFIVGNIISLAVFALLAHAAVNHLGVGGIGVALTVVYAISFFYLLVRIQWRGVRT